MLCVQHDKQNLELKEPNCFFTIAVRIPLPFAMRTFWDNELDVWFAQEM